MVLQQGHFTGSDIAQVVAIHRSQINQGFLSSLGGRTLDLIYSFVPQSRSGVLIVAKESTTGQVCGFICGTANVGVLYKEFLIQKTLSALIFLAPRLLSPRKLWKALETLIYPTKSKSLDVPDAELLVFAVGDSYKGTGLSHMLFDRFVQTLSEKGAQSFKIGTGASLTRAHRFYEKVGARKVASIEVHHGQQSFVYVYNIPAGACMSPTTAEVNNRQES